MLRRRPGHLNFPVDRRGVIFSGATREPIVEGLTRPHSARLRDGVIWIDNSGYGELGRVVDGTFEPVVRLPGWTRGLSFAGDIAFVGTSRVIPRFRRYAPGLDEARSECGIHAIDVHSGKIQGSLAAGQSDLRDRRLPTIPAGWRSGTADQHRQARFSSRLSLSRRVEFP
jgi:hypothetical protein